MRIALDSSVIVAALLTWHDQHQPAVGAIRGARDASATLLLPAPCLLEAYAVMTGLPDPHRVSPANAHELLESSFRDKLEVVWVAGRGGWGLVERLGQTDVSGARSHDAHIVACATQARADCLLTFNRGQFDDLVGAGLEVVVPGA